MMLNVAMRCALVTWIVAPLSVVLGISFISPTIPAANRAQIWMMATALFGWCTFSVVAYAVLKRLTFFQIPIPKSKIVRIASFVCLAALLAMIEEFFTQFMTDHASFFGVSPGEAYITPSLDYWDTVLHHSVVVFLPMFLIAAILSEAWKYSPKELFFLVGITGLTAEMTMNPASLFMGFWILIYGFMVLIPSKIFYRHSVHELRKWWHYPVSVLLMLSGGAVASLVIHAVYPNHPDSHFHVPADPKRS